jgi:tetratricopeptide (TPR) repeat protein
VRQEQGADGEPRFTMLETIREFGLEELSEDREVEPIQRRHAEFYARLAEEAEPVFLQMLPDQATWLVRFDAEHANLRAALSWFLNDGDPRLALRLAAALSWFWNIRVHLGEGRGWLERALAAAPLAPAIDRAKALFGACALTHYQGDEERALALGEESLALFREIGDRAGTGRALNLLGVVAEDRGDYDCATTLLEEALTLHQEDDDRPWTAHTLRHLGLVTYGLGDSERAMALVEEALALNRELGLTVGTTITLIYVGVVACEQGDVRRAAEAYAEALALASEQGARQGIARGLIGVASLVTFQGRHTSAARLFGAGDALCAALGYRFGLPERAQYNRARAAAKRELGDERFTAIWETGRGLPAEEAVNEALALTGELLASTNC